MEATVATIIASVSRIDLVSASATPEALVLAGALVAGGVSGIFGITDFLSDDDNDDDSGNEEVVFEDDDDLDGLGDFDDEGLGGLDDEADGLGGDDGNVTELENRLEELENEVAGISSSVNTVQNENEAVSETVQEVEENVRDLLEIYEMVTRGVNPFVDDTASGAMGGNSGGNFGLFDDNGGGEDEDGTVDDSIADADAEEFFEDDFDEPDGDELADPDDATVLSNDNGQDGVDEGSDDSDDGKSFAELKQEYESDDTEWSVDDPTEDDGTSDESLGDDRDEIHDTAGDDGTPDDPFGNDQDETDDAAGDDGTPDELFGDDQGKVNEPSADDETPDESFGDDRGEINDPAAGNSSETTPEELSDGGATTNESSAGFESDDGDAGPDDEAFEVGSERASESRKDSSPHLPEFPNGYVADLTALEWLEYLLDAGGANAVRDALAYYVDIGWISSPVEDDLNALLDGIRSPRTERGSADPGGLAQFDPEHHRRSLGYVARLAGDGDQAVLDCLEESPVVGCPESSAPATNPVADGSGPEDGGSEGGDGDGV